VSVEVGIRTAGFTDNEVQYTYATALAVEAVMPSAGQSLMSRHGLPLAHFSAQPKPFSSVRRFASSS